MTKRTRRETGSPPRRSGSDKQSALPTGSRRISLLELQAVILFVYCLTCACCALSSYVWGNASPKLAGVASLVPPQPTQIGMRSPIATSTDYPTPTPTNSPTSESTFSPEATPAHTSQSPLATPTTIPPSPSATPTPTPTSAPLGTPTLTQTPRPTPEAPSSTDTPTPTGTPSATPSATSTNTSTPTPTRTPTSTPLPSDLHIIHVEYAGFENEHVLIENRGPGGQEMTNWKLYDENHNTYYFQAGFTLSAGRVITVWTKSGVSTWTDLYWKRDNGVWGQDDTAYLEDNTGTIVDSFTWSSSE